MRRRWPALVIGAFLVGALAVVASYLFEKTDQVVDRGYRGEAAINPYYALEQLFESAGVPTRSLSRLRQLPPADHVLWVASPSRGTPADRLVSWAAEGGHLVVLPAGDWGEDPLLQALSIQRFGAPDADEDDDQSRPSFASERPDWPRLYLQDQLEVLRSEGQSDAAWLLTIRLGDGTATVLSDGTFLRNENLDKLDHALIAWQAVSVPTDAAAHDPAAEPVAFQLPAGLWIVYRDPGPSVWSLFSARALPVVVSLGVLILAALGRLTRRFGPLHATSQKHRRELAEHVRASGHFLWNIGCESVLIAATRHALRQRLGSGRQTSEDELVELAKRAPAATHIREAHLRRALTTWETRDRQEFTRVIRTLETLRRSS